MAIWWQLATRSGFCTKVPRGMHPRLRNVGVLPHPVFPGLAGSSTFTSLAILIPSSSSSNGPTASPWMTSGFYPGGDISEFRLLWECPGPWYHLYFRVEFLLKPDSGYPKDKGVTLFTLANPGNFLCYNTPQSSLPVSLLGFEYPADHWIEAYCIRVR